MRNTVSNECDQTPTNNARRSQGPQIFEAGHKASKTMPQWREASPKTCHNMPQFFEAIKREHSNDDSQF